MTASFLHRLDRLDLYRYAIGHALSALVSHAARSGRGWYLFVGGEIIVASEIVL